MKYRVYKEYEINNNVPNVLLTGNGVCGNRLSWGDAIKKITNSKEDLCNEISYPLQSSIRAKNISNEIKTDKYKQIFYEEYLYKDSPIINALIELPFDSFLTTNYTYEIENALISGFNNFPEAKQKIYRYWTGKNSDGSGIMLHGYTCINEHDIWHIHGDAYRKTSLVFSYDEYIKLIRKIVEVYDSRLKAYKKEIIEFKSWIDYLLLGNLYILGLGCDISEIDIWWLLLKRDKKARTVFMEPAPSKSDVREKAVREQMQKLGIEVLTLGMSKDELKNDYSVFYGRALDYLKAELI